MGAHCTGLRVVLRVSTLDKGPFSGDHEATWLLGHTERIGFGRMWRRGGDLFTEAELRVPCRFLEWSEAGPARCRAHGHSRNLPAPSAPAPEARRLGGDRFRIIERGRPATRTLPPPVRPSRELPIHAGTNPCVGAPCRTADNRRGAACCRDLQVEIMCTAGQRRLEALVRARQSPYLCKVDRETPESLNAEMISACAYLVEDGIHCALHGRHRADGRPAKPDLCSQWPEGSETLHPGCVFGAGRSG
jgi:hypothetical protein